MRRDNFGTTYVPRSASVPTGVSIRAGLSTSPRTTIAAACSAVSFLLDTNVISELRKRERANATLLDWFHGVADDEISYAIIAPLDLRWLYHPYDGGADVIAPTAYEHDVLKGRHADWLSAHPAGL